MYSTNLTEIPANITSPIGLAKIATVSLVGQEANLIIPGLSSIQVFLNASTPVGTAMYLTKRIFDNLFDYSQLLLLCSYDICGNEQFG